MSKDHPRLSVIVPVYNADKYLAKCIHSILAQDYQDFELILVDDGSTDKTPEICKGFIGEDSRIVYYRKENGGPFRARIYGAEHASGDFITFCDADDYYSSRKAFSKINKVLSEGDYDAIQFGFRIKYNHLSRKSNSVEKQLSIKRECFLSEEYPVFLCSSFEKSHLTLNVWNKVYKRQLLSELPSSSVAERLFWGDDLVQNLFALQKCNSFAVIPDTLYSYQDSTGGTTRFTKGAMRDLDCIKKYQLLFLQENHREDEASILSRIHCETACWLDVWIKDGYTKVRPDELKKLVEEALSLPQITRAREYFLAENSLGWKAIELLRHADPNLYVECAKESVDKKRTIMNRVKELYKRI